MKSFLFSIIFTLCTFVGMAEPSGEKALAELSQAMKELGHYSADISVNMGSNTIVGSYSVSGKEYHIDMGNIEMWGDAERRYEVSHKIEEVVVSKHDDEYNTLLSNPTSAFDAVGQNFEVELLQDGIIRITPKGDAQGVNVDSIEIWVDTTTRMPTKIVYKADADVVEIAISEIKKIKSPFCGIELSKYKKYDIVEF